MKYSIPKTRYKIDLEKEKLYNEDGEETPQKEALLPSGEYEEGLHDLNDILIKEKYELIKHLTPEVKDYIEDGIFDHKEQYVYINSEGVAVAILVINQRTEIQGLAVVKEYRRQGYGTKTVKEWIKQKNKNTIKVNGWFDEAEDFYRKLPFKVYKTRGEIKIL